MRARRVLGLLLFAARANGEDGWTAAPPMPFATGWATALAFDSKIYVIGGHPDYTALQIYDPSSDGWTTGPPLQYGRSSLAAAAVGSDDLYVAGGYAPASPTTSTSVVERFRASESAWSYVPSMPTHRWGPGAAAAAGQLYVFGGWDGHSQSGVGTVEIYTPATSSWRAAPPMPNGRKHVVTGLFEAAARVLVAGGYTSAGAASADAHWFDVATSAWSAAPPLGAARFFAASETVVGDNALYAVGGMSPTPATTVELYDAAADSWRFGPPLSVPRGCVATAYAGGLLYALGGYDGADYLSSVEAMAVDGPTGSPTVSHAPTGSPVPTPRPTTAAPISAPTPRPTPHPTTAAPISALTPHPTCVAPGARRGIVFGFGANLALALGFGFQLIIVATQIGGYCRRAPRAWAAFVGGCALNVVGFALLAARLDPNRQDVAQCPDQTECNGMGDGPCYCDPCEVARASTPRSSRSCGWRLLPCGEGARS